MGSLEINEEKAIEWNVYITSLIEKESTETSTKLALKKKKVLEF